MKSAALEEKKLHQMIAPPFDFVVLLSSTMDQYSPKKKYCQRTTSRILQGHVEVLVLHDTGAVELEVDVVVGIRGAAVNVAAHGFGLCGATQKASSEVASLDQDLQIVTLQAVVALLAEVVAVAVAVVEERRSDGFARRYGWMDEKIE